MVRICVFIAVLAALVGCDSTQHYGPSDSQPAPFAADVETWVMTSEISGREFQISVALPLGYSESKSTFPVLYALDANGQFGTVVETARILKLGEQVPQLIIVGIGYPAGGRQIHAETYRVYDLTPTENKEIIEARIRAFPDFPHPDGSGGGPDFLRFLRHELIPRIEQQYRADPSDRALYGHSLGGLFAIYALFQGQGTFHRFIIGSPSLWWDNRSLFSLEEAYSRENRELHARAFLSVGRDENDDHHPEEGGWGRMVTNFVELIEVLDQRNYERLNWQHKIFEDENHQSVLPANISRGLRFIYGAWPSQNQ